MRERAEQERKRRAEKRKEKKREEKRSEEPRNPTTERAMQPGSIELRHIDSSKAKQSNAKKGIKERKQRE